MRAEKVMHYYRTMLQTYVLEGQEGRQSGDNR